MLDSKRGRAVGVASLLCVLAGLCVWYGTLGPDPSAWAFPRTAQVLDDVPSYVGERVVLSGEVVSADPAVVSVAGTDGPVRFRLEGVDRPPTPGVEIRVFGVVESTRTLRTLGFVTTRPGGLAYAVVASLLGGLLALARLVRDWRVDPERWGLEPRGTPLSVRAPASGDANHDADGTGDRDA